MLPFIRRFFKNYKAGKLYLFAAAVLACSVLIYYGIAMQGKVAEPTPAKDAEVATQDNKIKVTANTDLVQKIVYTKCGDEEVFRTKPAENLIGLNYAQVQKVYSGWNIEKFDTQEIDMTLKVDSLCREHANNMFVGTKDGYVAVFYGKPGPKALLKEVTTIPINKLRPQDQEELQRGVVVQSKEELLQTLEGLQGQ